MTNGDRCRNDKNQRLIELIEGDITRLAVDAIVNAANSSLLGGGGVDGAIHRAAGPELLAECRGLGGCPTGEARITKGYRLPADRRSFTPSGRSGGEGKRGEEELLASCYRNCFALAAENNLDSIAFPAISTGVYGFPHRLAACIAVRESRAAARRYPNLKKIYFVCFQAVTREAYQAALDDPACSPLDYLPRMAVRAEPYFGVGKVKAAVQQPGRHYLLAMQDHGCHLAEDKGKKMGRKGRQPEGPVERPAEFLGKLVVGDRLGRCEVEGTVQLFMFQDKENGPAEIVQVNPGKGLAAGAEGTAQAQAEGRQHPVQGAAARAQNHRETAPGHPNPCRQRPVLPLLPTAWPVPPGNHLLEHGPP